MSVQKIEVATFLHICSFPESDVLSFVETHLEVVERDTNTSLYRRTVSVEDHCKTFPFAIQFFLGGGRKEEMAC